jgi:hypothetical protein
MLLRPEVLVMLDAKSEAKSNPTDAKNTTQPTQETNENLNLTTLLPQQNAAQTELPNNWEFQSQTKSYTDNKYLNNLMIDDTDRNRAIDGYFAKADLDGNGYVDRNEIDKSKEDKSFSSEESIIRSMLDGGVEIVQNQNNDEWGKENSGATRFDITKAFDNWMKYSSENESLYKIQKYLQPIFDTVDADKNDFLTKEELTNPDIPNSDFATELKGALAANTLLENFDAAKGSHNDGLNERKGISLDDSLAYMDKTLRRPEAEAMYKLDKIFGQIALS